MSLNRIPGLGKSGMSRMYAFRSIAVLQVPPPPMTYSLPPAEATMGPTIRRAVEADAPLVAEYNQRLAQETEGRTLDAGVLAAGVAAVLADPRKGLYFVAELDGALVGQLMVTTEWS